MLAAHCSLDDRLLHRPALIGDGFCAVRVPSEPAFEFLPGVVVLSTPAARGVDARRIAQPPHQLARLRELIAHPGWHYRVSSRYRQPRESVREWPPGLRGVLSCPGLRFRACGVLQQPPNCALGFGLGWTRRASQAVEKRLVTGAMTITSDQPTPGSQKVRCCLRERSLLVGQHLQREPRIQFRIIPSSPPKLA